MTIRDLLEASAPTLSYEFFPPRTPEAKDALWDSIARLAETRPDFASITYGANGATRTSSRDVVRRLATTHTIPPLAHLTCVDASRDEITTVIEEFLAEGVRDFLALRGDPPPREGGWRPHPDGLLYAYQLVGHVRGVAAAHGLARDEVSVGVTAFPAAHASAPPPDQGLEVLRAKQAAGADFAVTQVFYEAKQYVNLMRDARSAGIDLPILPGIMPLVNSARAARLAEMTGVPAPADLFARLKEAEATGDADGARELGVAHAAALARQLLEAGAPGIHIYTFNRHEAPLELARAAGLAT